MCAEQATAMLIVTVMIGLVTSTQNTLTRAPRAEEVEEVTAIVMIGLHLRSVWYTFCSLSLGLPPFSTLSSPSPTTHCITVPI